MHYDHETSSVVIKCIMWNTIFLSKEFEINAGVKALLILYTGLLYGDSYDVILSISCFIYSISSKK